MGDVQKTYIFTGCILTPVHADYVDKTVVVSVMSRHTREDGKTPDPRLKYDVHMPHLAPDPAKVGAWYRKEITWEEFTSAYLEKLRSGSQTDFWIKFLIGLANKRAVIVACIENHHTQCHRGILVQYISDEWIKKNPRYGPIKVKHLEDVKKEGP